MKTIVRIGALNNTLFKISFISGLFLFAILVPIKGQLINGNFETGDFTGWTLFNTPNGGSSLTQVVQFDTAGTGVPSSTAEFEVGETTGGVGGGGLGRGAGISQSVVLGAGQLNVFFDIAATSLGNNADAGTFELLLDGNIVASDALGGISVSQTIRSTISYTGTVGAGTHSIAIEMLRGYGTEYPETPFQYLDNIALSGTAVPEPSCLSLIWIGLLTFCCLIRKRTRLIVND